MLCLEDFYYLEDKYAFKIRENYKNKYVKDENMTLENYTDSVNNLPITFNSYQAGTRWSSQFTDKMPAPVYCTLGVCGEAGELAEKVKKWARNSDCVTTEEFKEGITKEIGDVLWYLAALADQFNIKMEDVAKLNQLKLVDRLKRNVIKSEGDSR